MKRSLLGLIAFATCMAVFTSFAGSQPPGKKDGKGKKKGPLPVAADTAQSEVSIQWFATLTRGLAVAQRTGKPILFASAAPHCAGVSGMW